MTVSATGVESVKMQRSESRVLVLKSGWTVTRSTRCRVPPDSLRIEPVRTLRVDGGEPRQHCAVVRMDLEPITAPLQRKDVPKKPLMWMLASERGEISSLVS